MRKLLVIPVIALALTGCSTTPTLTELKMPDGTDGFGIRCDGNHMSWSDCFEKAGEMCGNRGYEIFAKEANESTNGVAGANWANTATKVTRTLLMRCK
jgi:hypothetical protein